MNWLTFAIAAWFALGLELGLRPALRLGPEALAPSFMLPLAVFVCLWAPHRVALWACLACGLLVDLTWRHPISGGGAATVLGPYALGYFLGGQLVLTLRGVLIRGNPLTMAVMSMLAAAVVHVVVVAAMTVRSLYGDPIDFSPALELLVRLGASAYTGVAGLALSLLLIPLTPAFGFQQQATHRRIARRA